MAKPKNLAGLVFGRLTAQDYVKPSRWRCICACGVEKNVSSHNLLNGTANSCGCLKNEQLAARRRTHGMTSSPTYIAWCNMKARCYNPSYRGYENYGGRGIKVCDRWLNSFENFLADMGERPEGLSLDRDKVDLDYTPENCQWRDWPSQMNNQRKTVRITLGEKTMSLAQWARETGVNARTIRRRMNAGMTAAEALSS